MTNHDSEQGGQAVPRLDALAHFMGVFESLGVLVLLVALVCAASIIAPGFSTYTNITNTIIMASITAAAGLGMTFAIAVGGFDLSVGSVQALTAIVAASLLAVASVPIAIIAALLTGLVLGLLNGVIITKLKIPAFVVTFGMMSIVRGVALLVTQGQSVMITKHPDFATLNNGKVLGVPVPFIIVLIVLTALYLILHHTPFGRHTCAIGGNRAAAIASGINVDRVTILVFGLVGVTAAISGVMLSSQLMIVDGTLGTGLELQAIAISVLGGSSLSGGNGNLVGTLLAALLLATIASALNILKVAAFYQYLFVGVLLIFALSIDTVRRIILAKVMLRRI